MGEYSDYLNDLYQKYKDVLVCESCFTPIISIIIPCYNVEKYLEKCLESIIYQTFKDFEIICVDDGSEDFTSGVLNAYQRIDKRIKVITKINEGPSVARNVGLKFAKGKFITFVDADDWIDNNYLEELYSAIVKNNSDISIASIIREKGLIKKYRIKYEHTNTFKTLADKIKICDLPNCCYIWNKLYTKDLLTEFIPNIYYEDVMWLPEILKKAKSISTVSRICYHYRAHKNSIVKSVQSSKKQEDSYNSKKYIIKFFEENNIYLSSKYKNVTKKIFYILSIPILKIKEYKFDNTIVLFSFIPIFKYKDFDSHYLIKILNIKLAFRHKTHYKLKQVRDNGTNNIPRQCKIIVSLTSYPPRIKYVYKSISTLLQQSLKPDKVILWLARTDFPNKEKDLPNDLLYLCQYGLEICWCEDLLSYKKLIPALKMFPEDIIVTADDDLYYNEKWLESLYIEYLKDTKNIYVKRAIKMHIKNNSIKSYPKEVQKSFKQNIASYNNQLMSGSGCLFPPHSLYKDILNENKFLMLLPTHDDIYLWIMAIKNKTKIKVVGGFNEELLPIDGTEDASLCKINRKNCTGISPDEAFTRVLNEYPDVLEILNET